MKRKYLHIAMYRTMDFIYDGLKNPPEDLIQFLSDSNPYIWENRTTADPAVQSAFDNSMSRQNIGSEVDEEVGYYAVKKFLFEQNSNFAKMFENISIAEWKKICKIIFEKEKHNNLNITKGGV